MIDDHHAVEHHRRVLTADGRVRDDQRGARRVASDDDVAGRRLQLPGDMSIEQSAGCDSGTGTPASANTVRKSKGTGC